MTGKTIIGALGALAASIFVAAPSWAQEEERLPSPTGQPDVQLPPLTPELRLATFVCYQGRLLPTRMAELANQRGFASLSAAEAEEVAPGASQKPDFAAWTEGEGDDRTRAVTYRDEIGGIPHQVCVIKSAKPRPAETFNIVSLFLGPPNRDAIRGDRRILSWFWQEEDRYAMADYIVNADGSDATFIAKATLSE